MKVGDLVIPKFASGRFGRVGIVLGRAGSGRNGHATVLFSDPTTMPNPCNMPVFWLEVISESR